MRTRNSSDRSALGGKALEAGKRAAMTRATKLRKKWQFAPDAIGMIDGPKDLSRRKGLSG